MTLFLTVLTILILFVIICFLANFLRHSFKAQKKGLPPYVNTFWRHRSLIRDTLPIAKGSSVLDLGCSDGTMLRLFVKHFQCAKAVGYDINSFAIRWGRIMNGFFGTRNVKLIKDNIYYADVSGFDYVYLYLFQDFVADLETWLFERIDPGTIVICNTFHFTDHTPFQIIKDKYGKERLYLYKK